MATMCLLAASSVATALPENGNGEKSAFVDSVYEWGAWELGIEPAAGGPAPAANRALNVRLTDIKFRPNDNTAFSPGASTVTTTPATPPPFKPGGKPVDTGTPDLH